MRGLLSGATDHSGEMTRPVLDAESWLRRYHAADGGAVDLVCLPHVGGSATFFFPLSRALAPRLRVFAVQYPGRQERYREPTIGDLGELAGHVVAAIREVTAGPLALFGHSMGAVLAYEVALGLCRAGCPEPVRLFVSGRRAPSRYRTENVHLRDDAGVTAELRRLAGPHTALLADPELLRLILPVIRRDYRAIETYRHDPRDRLAAPITVLTGDRDPMVTLEEADDWRRHTTGPVDVRVFAGGHFFLVDHVPEIADLVGDALDEFR
jgi:pyochelin biosynthesis protein PchC